MNAKTTIKDVQKLFYDINGCFIDTQTLRIKWKLFIIKTKNALKQFPSIIFQVKYSEITTVPTDFAKV
jgi:hypothetical protein